MTKELTISWGGKVRSRIISGETLADFPALLQGEREIFIIFDESVTWIAQDLTSALPVKACFGMETSEEGKTMETVMMLERQLLEADASRGALLVAVGGGITSDITGFVASIYKRGIRYVNLPTTLLAQVDASIGGKTGVNLDGYKNMLGAFRQPLFTFLCPEPLSTLPPRELRAGIAEMLKTFLIADGAAYAAALQSLPRTETPDFVLGLLKWVFRAAEIKAGVVSRDPFEQGERAVLNLGHTFGHAIEHEALQRGDDILHGEAVAMGMILAARLSEKMGIAAKGLAEQLRKDFEAVGLPTQCPYDNLVEAMAKDKKAGGGKVKFILPEAPGKVRMVELSPSEACQILES